MRACGKKLTLSADSKKDTRATLGQTCAIPAIKCEHSHNVTLHYTTQSSATTVCERKVFNICDRSHALFLLWRVNVCVCFVVVYFALSPQKKSKMTKRERRRKRAREKRALRQQQRIIKTLIYEQSKQFVFYGCLLPFFSLYFLRQHQIISHFRRCVCFQFSASSLASARRSFTPLTMCMFLFFDIFGLILCHAHSTMALIFSIGHFIFIYFNATSFSFDKLFLVLKLLELMVIVELLG